MKLTIKPIEFYKLKPGDLYSEFDFDTWGEMLANHSYSGYKVHIRSEHNHNAFCKDIVFLITIEKEETNEKSLP